MLENREDCCWCHAQPSNGNSYEAASIFFSQVKNMTEEVESVNDNGKLNRAAKIIQETHRQTLDDLPREEEELSNLSQAKLKSEQQVDKLGDDMICLAI